MDFTYSAHNDTQLATWETRGVLNPTPVDGAIAESIQSGPSTGFVSWDDTSFFDVGLGSCTIVQMSDVFGHDIEWCSDSNSRVTRTQVEISASGSGAWLSTEQAFDANNNLTSMTDPRGNMTQLGYDANGNIVEVTLPRQTTYPNGAVSPTWFLDYNTYNDVTYICDPANNASNGWQSVQTDTLCENSGSTNYTRFQYGLNDPNEAYGCLKNIYKPSHYASTLSYPSTEPCGSGLPTTIQGQSYSELDGTNRTPTLDFAYNVNGTVEKYDDGNSTGTWQLDYSCNSLNLVCSNKDPDGVTSYECYNQDGSIFFAESAQQDVLDNGGNGPLCPTVSQLEAGATPPNYATAYAYDPDGDIATVTHHHNCLVGACAANNSASTGCNNVAVSAGTTCDFYDGLDRLVEVKQPYDSTVDVYTNPWITRYLYDLSGASISFDGASISGYGNLFETEELVNSNGQTQHSGPLTLGQISNTQYEPIKAASYDGADRPIALYAGVATGAADAETFTWDSSPLDANLGGLLGKICNSASAQQCQKFDYFSDGELMTFESNDGSSPERNYTYDPDGQTTKVVSSAHNMPQVYTYDVDGNLQTSEDATSDTGTGAPPGRATLTYNRYGDGMLKSIDVSSGALTQSGLFKYSYREDGPLQTKVVDDSQVAGIQSPGKTTLSYTYTNTGRLLTEAGNGGLTCNTNTATICITYNTSPVPTGLVQKEVTPPTTLSQFVYTAEDELESVTPSAGGGLCGGNTYSYSLRGELANQPSCSSNETFLANGVSFQTPSLQGQQSNYVWNDLMGTINNSYACQWKNCSGASWQYDGAGRMNNEQAAWSVNSGSNTLTSRTYDSENHITNTTISGTPSQTVSAVVNWGPDGHPITIGTSVGGAQASYERLHWNGNNLLYTTHQSNGNDVVDDIKVDDQADILPGDNGYNDLTFYDRGPGGLNLGCQNATGTAYVGLTDTWMGSSVAPCSQNLEGQNVKMPTSTMWSGSPYDVSNINGNFIGTGGTLGMPRPDGMTDGFDTIQGVRAYDSLSGQWMTPDAFGGELADPVSQKSYVWNSNNPVINMDPSGYCNNGTCVGIGILTGALIATGVLVFAAAFLTTLPFDVVGAGVWVSLLGIDALIDLAGATGLVDAEAAEATPFFARLLARPAVKIPGKLVNLVRLTAYGLGFGGGTEAAEASECLNGACKGPYVDWVGLSAPGYWIWPVSLTAGAANPPGFHTDQNDGTDAIQAAIYGPTIGGHAYCPDCVNQFPGLR